MPVNVHSNARSPRSRQARPSRPSRLWARAWAATAWSCVSVSLASPAAAADPTKDQCIDANETAQALRKNEKLHDAEQRLLVCVSATCPGPVRDDCAQRLTELRSIVPTLVFVVKDDADQDLSAVHVTMDAQPLTDRLDGTAIAIDPGPHRFTFEAAGRVREERSLVVREGEKDRHERIVLVATHAAAPPVAATATQVSEAAPPAAETTPSDGKTQRIAGLTLGGVGIAGVVVGSVLGVLAKSKYSDALSGDCNSHANTCNANGVSDGQSAHSEAAVSTVAFVAGLALLGGGAVLYFTAPKAGVTVAPTVGLQSAGVAVGGTW